MGSTLIKDRNSEESSGATAGVRDGFVSVSSLPIKPSLPTPSALRITREPDLATQEESPFVKYYWTEAFVSRLSFRCTTLDDPFLDAATDISTSFANEYPRPEVESERGVVALEYDRPDILKIALKIDMSSIKRWEPMTISGRDRDLDEDE